MRASTANARMNANETPAETPEGAETSIVLASEFDAMIGRAYDLSALIGTCVRALERLEDELGEADRKSITIAGDIRRSLQIAEPIIGGIVDTMETAAMWGLAGSTRTAPQGECSTGRKKTLMQAIRNYVSGMGLFNAVKETEWPGLGGEEAVIEKTYGPPLAVLEKWKGAAATREEAIEALKLALNDGGIEGFDFEKAMISAALGYLSEKESAGN